MRGDVRKTLSNFKIPRTTKQFHSTLKHVRMITTHPTLSDARLLVSKSAKSMFKIINKRLLDTTPKQHGSKSFHGGMTKTILYFFTTTNDKMQGFLTMAAYLTI